MIKKLNQHVVFRYIISGSTAAFATLSSLFILNTVLHVYYLLASVIAYCIGFIFSFILQKFWTFKNPSIKKIHHQLILYMLSSFFGLSLNTFLMFIFVDGFHMYVFLSQIFAGILVACVTFFISRRVFRIKDPVVEIAVDSENVYKL